MARYTPSAKGHSAGAKESIAKAEELVNMELMPLKGEESKEFKASMKVLKKKISLQTVARIFSWSFVIPTGVSTLAIYFLNL